MKIAYVLLCVIGLTVFAPVHADAPGPNQVVQGIVDDLGKTMDALERICRTTTTN